MDLTWFWLIINETEAISLTGEEEPREKIIEKSDYGTRDGQYSDTKEKMAPCTARGDMIYRQEAYRFGVKGYDCGRRYVLGCNFSWGRMIWKVECEGSMDMAAHDAAGITSVERRTRYGVDSGVEEVR